MRRLAIPGTGLTVNIDPGVGDTPVAHLGTLYLDEPSIIDACCVRCHAPEVRYARVYAGTPDTGVLRFGEVTDCLACRQWALSNGLN